MSKWYILYRLNEVGIKQDKQYIGVHMLQQQAYFIHLLASHRAGKTIVLCNVKLRA
jgi:hypothetical protein